MSTKDLKIIFTGPVGTGKTTAITSISDTPPMRTNEITIKETKKSKKQTEVTFDFGTLNINGREKIHLYGTPEQEKFNGMWEIITENVLGLIILIDNSRSDPFNDLMFFLNAFKVFINETELAIGITKMDKTSSPALSLYNKKLRELQIKAAVFEVDARSKTDLSLLVQALLFSIDHGLEQAS